MGQSLSRDTNYRLGDQLLRRIEAFLEQLFEGLRHPHSAFSVYVDTLLEILVMCYLGESNCLVDLTGAFPSTSWNEMNGMTSDENFIDSNNINMRICGLTYKVFEPIVVSVLTETGMG